MKVSERNTNPLEYVHDILKGKWKTTILWQLHYKEGCTTTQLKKCLKGISEKMLLEQLSELRLYGLVEKSNHSDNPLSAKYYLSEEKGKKIIKALEIMEEIGEEYLDGYNPDENK